MIELLSPAEVERARPAGRFVAGVLAELRDSVGVGTDLMDVDALVARRIAEAGATSCYVDYAPSFGRGPFAHWICTSVNDAVLHGRPHPYRLQRGDLLSLDLAVEVEGWVADSALTVVVGAEPTPAEQHMIDTTDEALAAGIDALRVGNRLGDVSAAIGGVLRGAGYRVNTDFGGHGVGRTMHQEPHVPNDGRARRGMPIKPGLLVALEPWVMVDTDELVTDDDGWTLRSATGGRGVHVEHTCVVTPDGPEVLTLRD
ncbi:type I methionyl aminopeptidase [Pseudokineococcus lusitanus]|uniref:Methionine aminopeptidase n=1 Tax=Pseudokineococcus lusitanus TaxID=763993 RepID=A0A3N1HT62_9ACTN|nr:type I methionyl aminopeptidase [Pseudokineococcus lusitanus]ROP45576.1 methionine aminopeptidase type I [Pseudokineococcus lusitanus]